MTVGAEAWARACLALELLALEPAGLRGLAVRARAGPVRDIYLDAIRDRLPQITRAHALMPAEAFFGGVDITGSLAAGNVVETEGLAARDRTLVLGMAERCPATLAARLAGAIDECGIGALILLDEGADDDERTPRAVSDRVALQVTLDGIGRLEAMPPPQRTSTARREVEVPKGAAETLVTVAARLGVPGLRAPILALRAATAHAALNGRDEVAEDDLRAAVELVLAPRATRLPPQDEPEVAPQSESEGERKTAEGDSVPEDILVDAARALIPAGLLDASPSGSARGTSSGEGFGQRAKGNRRGRPLPSRPGRLGGTARIDLVATLRAAAPWQGLRGRETGPPKLRPSDIRLRRYESLSDRLVIFAVDASGSAALNRLAEAKGAIELLLAETYARRDQVALVAFRGESAELLLPPTRSLTQTKRRLQALPGGGGTPLAAGLTLTCDLAEAERRKGLAPVIAVLTDGRANIALDGRPDREWARADAEAAARRIAAAGIASVVLDVSPRPNPGLTRLSSIMRARYVALPHAGAETMSDALKAAMEDEVGA